ncbi:MAG: TylF/MycF/NovP-related O-methyltransferase [Thermoplasmata archaeon]
MTRPTSADVSGTDRTPAETRWLAESRGTGSTWAYASLAEVETNVASTGFPKGRTVFVKGPVEATIPGTIPERIALLRLDTDWYESTKHELQHLYPRLTPGGVLIVDDYGHWLGAKRAVDEYFAAHAPAPLLHRIDYTGRIGVKSSA